MFTPTSRTLSNVTMDQVADFPAMRVVQISGQVKDLNDTGVRDVTMTLSGSQSATLTTDVSGN
ncbi:hypothetical protein, partial [Salmonella sp. SAL4458]|uniref:hypothetical protein n=1 Tax=Salmonella sp. SAL4458 TaxID=3159913 RepID=UPI00397A52E8